MNQPKLTVLMPVYNAEKFLVEAIDSILNQTLTDFEFLIIDDGSRDSSSAIIKSYKDPRIRFIQNERNLGISATLNKGIALSGTELIARMDADDISYPERLQRQYDYFQSHNECALVSSWAREITEDGQALFTEKFNSDFYQYILNFECWIYHPTVMYKRSAVLACNGYSERYCEDYDLWWKLSRRYQIANLSEVLLDYRSTADSLCRVTNKEEYELGHRCQILRNVRYYTGRQFELTEKEIDCLRYNCEEMLESDLSDIVAFFAKLDNINNCIFRKDFKENIASIKRAARFKRNTLLSWFLERLTVNQKLQLLVQTGSWRMLGDYSTRAVNKMSDKIFKRSHVSPSANY
jgi:glycosyltransferase involved in cell wall biosynthesis